GLCIVGKGATKARGTRQMTSLTSTLKHGSLSLTRQINAPAEKTYEACTRLEHRKHGFVGPAWTEIDPVFSPRSGRQHKARGASPRSITKRSIEPAKRVIAVALNCDRKGSGLPPASRA